MAGNCIAAFYIWCEDNRETLQEFSSAETAHERILSDFLFIKKFDWKKIASGWIGGWKKNPQIERHFILE